MDRIAHAKEWIKYAQADFDTVSLLKNHHPIHIEIICFHCQQAAEKALKAILAYHDEDIPRTHDLIPILELCEAHCPGVVDEFSDQADRLSGFAVIQRYPNEIETTKEDMDAAIKAAEQILSYVKSLW